jgi:hypothetical protein
MRAMVGEHCPKYKQNTVKSERTCQEVMQLGGKSIYSCPTVAVTGRIAIARRTAS